MKPRLVTTLVLVIFCAACAGKQRFRAVQPQNDCFGQPGASPATVDSRASSPAGLKPSLDCRHTLYTVGYIEFDEQGQAFDREQEAQALRLIEHQKKVLETGKIITLVYVHGWKNNAAEALPGGKPKDVERFQRALLELGLRSRVAAGGGTPVPVVGIYIGWRGKSLTGPNWFTFLSYWGRRNTANRVGAGPELAGVLNRVISKTNEGSTGSRVLLIGHSFGARLLEQAIETKKVTLYDAQPQNAAATPRVDLVLYVNSANDARLSMARVQTLAKDQLHVRHPDFDPENCKDQKQAETATCRHYPLFVAITSRGDLATKFLLGIANALNMDKGAAPDAVPPTGTFADEVPGAGTFRKKAAAHMPFLQSHTVRTFSCPAAAPPPPPPPADTLDQVIQKKVDAAIAKALNKQTDEDKAAEARKELADAARRAEDAARQKEKDANNGLVCAPDDKSCRFAFRTQGDPTTCLQVDDRSIDAKPAPFNTTAFWIMDVDPLVINDHGDIWNLSFVEMLGQLMAPRGFFNPSLGRVQLRATPRAK